MEERFFIAAFEGKWYLVSTSASNDWYQWMQDMSDYRIKPDDFVREPSLPEKVDLLDSFGTVTFTNPLIEPF